MTAKSHLYATSVILLSLCVSCSGVPTTLCVDIEDNCSGGSDGIAHPVWLYYVTGLPLNRVEHVVGTDTYRATLKLADTVTFRLYFILGSSPGANASQVAVHKWSVVDSTVARISSDASGVATVVAIGPGQLLPLVADGTPYSVVYACDTGNSCKWINEILVVQ